MFAAIALYVRNLFSSWTTHLTLYAVAATMGLIGFLYFVSSGHAVLSRIYSPEIAGLIVGGVFVVLALVMMVVVKMRASRTPPATKGLASLAIASTAGRLAIRNGNSLGYLAGYLAKPALATAGAGMLLLGRLLGRPGVEQRGRDLAEDPLSLRESFSAFTAAAQRAAGHAASEASQKWEEVEPELKARAAAVRKELPHLLAQLPSITKLIAAPRRSLWPWRRQESAIERLMHSMQNRETVGTLAVVIAVGALAIWLSRSDEA